MLGVRCAGGSLSAVELRTFRPEGAVAFGELNEEWTTDVPDFATW
jgi:hypothetical protein